MQGPAGQALYRHHDKDPDDPVSLLLIDGPRYVATATPSSAYTSSSVSPGASSGCCGSSRPSSVIPLSARSQTTATASSAGVTAAVWRLRNTGIGSCEDRGPPSRRSPCVRGQCES
jgi:hypothetical protein